MAALGKLLGLQLQGPEHAKSLHVPVQAEATPVRNVLPVQVAYQSGRTTEPWLHEPTLQQYLEGGPPISARQAAEDRD